MIANGLLIEIDYGYGTAKRQVIVLIFSLKNKNIKIVNQISQIILLYIFS